MGCFSFKCNDCDGSADDRSGSYFIGLVAFITVLMGAIGLLL